ncbi:dockerin [Pelomonas sp. Root1217]|uniref:dockerin n=1 Tax=Pelomonas sp. Root1217 TaxID=1736430 RepID=UPI0009E71941|nr:dockerin [Pelomonas sp. Root1217]
MRTLIHALLLAFGTSAAPLALAQTCAPTAITPYINVNGTWTQTASATIKTGASAILGPQPISGGMWSWSGCGTAGAAREQTIQPAAACTATATYTNSCGAKSQQAFSIKVGTWNSVKWGGGGYVDGLIYHPTTPNLLYARTDVGGAYRWNQATSQWVPITDGPGFGGGIEGAFHTVESIALDPTNDQRVYMVAGDSKKNARLYISSNRGDSWTWVTLPFLAGADTGRAIGERLRLDPTNPSTMFYGSTKAGLWKSTNSGQTWAQVTGLSSYTTTNAMVGVEQIIFDNGNVGGGQPTWNMWAAIAPDYATAAGLTSTFYRSSNNGYSWTPVAVPAAVAGYYIPHFARAADGNYYVVFNKNAGPGGDGPGYLYKYTGINGGAWTLLSSTTTGGYGGVSVYGSGPTTRIALAVSATWGDFTGQKITQLSDNAGSTWREIESMMPHEQNSAGYWGWNDDIEIDPNNRDHILHLDGPGIWETMNASSATPSWTTKLNNLEETATLALITPPAGATYKFISSAGDIGPWVQTDLATTPTKGPNTGWSNGNSADMSWSDPQYIALIGVTHGDHKGFGYWSGDGGTTWTRFATLPPGAATNTHESSNIAVTSRNNAIWAPADTVPSYTTNNGASWTATNLPALPETSGFPRSYRLAVDRRNPNKVYAYDSGGSVFAGPGKFYVSTDGGHNFTLSQGSVSANMKGNPYFLTGMAVNPNVEGDIWVADGNTVYHSVDSGATWTKFNNFASVFGSDFWPDVNGASALTLGKAAPGATYSAAVYVVGVINGQWGLWASNNAGSTWTRFNDDAHQFGGITRLAGDWNTYGRIYAAGGGRGVLYSN